MVTPTRIGVAGLKIAFGINLPSQVEIGIQRICIVIGINEIATSIVGWINVDGFDATEVGLIEEFKDLKIVAFNKEVLGGVKIKRVVATGF